MRTIRFLAIFLVSLTLVAPLSAQANKKRLLAIGEVKGFEHDAVSHALGTIWKIGQESGLYDTYIRTDTELITKKKLGRNAKNLDYFDAVFFYTSGELGMDDQQKADFLSFVRDEGKGFLAAHSANDTFYKWPEYGEMVGGYFDGHPWGQFQAPMIVEDSNFPAMKPFPGAFTIMDEIYQAREFSRERVRVLMRLDESKINLKQKGVNRTDGDFAVTWVRNYGKGRVFYCGLGHRAEVWDRADVQKMWLEAIKWAMGLIPGDATPRPKPAH
jgi:type 1 glutamine amidotransferase